VLEAAAMAATARPEQSEPPEQTDLAVVAVPRTEPPGLTLLPLAAMVWSSSGTQHRSLT